jgi:hypothetical protein
MDATKNSKQLDYPQTGIKGPAMVVEMAIAGHLRAACMCVHTVEYANKKFETLVWVMVCMYIGISAPVFSLRYRHGGHPPSLPPPHNRGGKSGYTQWLGTM